LRKLRLPSDHLAADEQSGALLSRIRLCGSELFDLPHNKGLGRSFVRSQRDWFCFDGDAHVAFADTLRFLPCEQQLHTQFDGLLRLPPGSFPEHHDNWRVGTESRHVRIPDYGSSLRDVPPDYYLGRGSF
jgi:hypothetical protein